MALRLRRQADAVGAKRGCRGQSVAGAVTARDLIVAVVIVTLLVVVPLQKLGSYIPR